MEHPLKRTLIIPVLLASAFCQAQTQISATDALKLASQNRPSLAASRLGVEEARLSARALSALPPLNLAAGASSRSEVGATDQDLALTQEIDIFGRRRASGRVGEADVQLALARYRKEAGLLQSEVLTAFAIAVSASQLTRRNNGLTLTGKTIRERLASFVSLFSDEGTLTLIVTKVVERAFQQADGSNSTSRYLKFELA